MAKRRKSAEAVEDTFQDLDVTLNDGLEVVEEIEASQDEEEIVEEVVVEEPAPVVKKAAPKKKAEKKAAGIYYQGQLVEVVLSQNYQQWVAFVGGKKVKGAPSEFEVVE